MDWQLGGGSQNWEGVSGRYGGVQYHRTHAHRQTDGQTDIRLSDFISVHCHALHWTNNKSAQSNLGRGHIAALSHTYAVKSKLVTMARPKFAPKSTPFVDRSPNPTTCLIPSISLDPSDLWCQTASGSDPPFCHNALDRPTDTRTYVLTDGSSTGKFDNYRPLCYENDAA